MNFITSKILESWADDPQSISLIPILIRKLIRASVTNIKYCSFPARSNVHLPGLDGLLETENGNEFIPKKISYWELGTGKDIKKKADKDYLKRKREFHQEEASNITYVFVTPRLFSEKENWVKRKNQEAYWKEVRVIDGKILEEWMENAPTVSAWFAKEILGDYPYSGIITLEDFWANNTIGKHFKLIPDIFLVGREKQKDKLLEQFKFNTPKIIRSGTKRESIAFVISCFKSLIDGEEDLFARSIIVTSSEALFRFSSHISPLIIIPWMELDEIPYSIIQKGHTIILPLDQEFFTNEPIIHLPPVKKEGLIHCLMKMGMNRRRAEREAFESSCNVTILWRRLNPISIPNWWKQFDEWIEILPALMVGKWDESFEGDKEIVAIIAKMDYENFSRILNKWKNKPDTPIVQIDTVWRIQSTFEVWSLLFKYLVKEDLVRLELCALEIFKEIDPHIGLNLTEEIYGVLKGTLIKKYSKWIKKGISHSMTFISITNEQLNSLNSPLWIDTLVMKILKVDNTNHWKSLDFFLPDLAEASPTSFLNFLEIDLKDSNSIILRSLKESSSNPSIWLNHTGLLRALEGLAWFPQYLCRSSLILAKLSELSSKSNFKNSPKNSLNQIYKAWHIQTLASKQSRFEVLELLSKNYPEVAWSLLLSLLGTKRDIALENYRMLWRNAIEDVSTIPNQDIYETQIFSLEVIKKNFDNSEEKLLDLLEVLDLTHWIPVKQKILEFIENIYSVVDHKNNLVWNSLRKMLHAHKTHQDTDWALNNDWIKRLESLYHYLEPKDLIERTIWMFNESWPTFLEDYDQKQFSYEDREPYIFIRRTEELKKIYNEFGLDKILEFRFNVKEYRSLGYCLGEIIEEPIEILRICEDLNLEPKDFHFVQCFIGKKVEIMGLSWLFNLFSQLQEQKYPDIALGKLLTSCFNSEELWDFVGSKKKSISNVYWINFNPNFSKLPYEAKKFGITQLLKAKRYFLAIRECYYNREKISSGLIAKSLDQAISNSEEYHPSLDPYIIAELMELLDVRDDLSNKTIANLQWKYLTILWNQSHDKFPTRLHKELAQSCKFFVEILEIAYFPMSTGMEDVQNEGLSSIQAKKNASRLLESWDILPGLTEGNGFNPSILIDWLEEVRKLLSGKKIMNYAFRFIGKALSKFSDHNSDLWPPKEICAIIEKYKNPDLNQGFKMGFTNRNEGIIGSGAYTFNRDYFYSLEEKHRNTFPEVSLIFNELGDLFKALAKEDDIRQIKENIEF